MKLVVAELNDANNRNIARLNCLIYAADNVAGKNHDIPLNLSKDESWKLNNSLDNEYLEK